MGAWIDRYQAAGIAPADPPNDLKELCAPARLVCSAASRCIESMRRIAPGREILPDCIYREAGLPYGHWSYPKLPAELWALLFRAAWFCGFSARAESLAEANSRAQLGARQLMALTRAGQPVFLMGHGIMNALIARQLLTLGCRGPARPASRHWGFSVYQLP